MDDSCTDAKNSDLSTQPSSWGLRLCKAKILQYFFALLFGSFLAWLSVSLSRSTPSQSIRRINYEEIYAKSSLQNNKIISSNHTTNRKKLVFIVGTDTTFLPLFLNHMISLRRFGRYSLQAECYDEFACEYLRKAGFSLKEDYLAIEIAKVLYEKKNCPKHHILALARIYVMFARLELYKHLLEDGHDIFMTDADTCWIRRPEAAFRGNNFDAIFAAHLGEVKIRDFSKNFVSNSNISVRLNPGIAYVRSTMNVLRSFFPRVMADSMNHICDAGFAQGAVSRQLEEMGLELNYEPNGDYLYGNAGNVRIKTVSFMHYRHGCTADYKKPAPLRTAVFIHPNCHNLVKEKVPILKENGCWFLQENWRTAPAQDTLDEFLLSISTLKDFPAFRGRLDVSQEIRNRKQEKK